MVWTLYRPCFHRAFRLRSKPSGVRGPVLVPPWNLHRPLAIAGPLHCVAALVRAPHRGALSGLPVRLPFFRRPKFRDTWGSLVILAPSPEKRAAPFALPMRGDAWWKRVSAVIR
jgi:hypothetical protein